MANVSEMRKRWVGLVGSKTTATTLSSITIHHHTSIIHHPSSIGLVESSVKDHLRIQAKHSVVYDHQTATYYSYITQDMPRNNYATPNMPRSAASQMIIYKYKHNDRKP